MSDMKEAGVVKAQLADREHSALDGSLFQSSSYETILTKVGYADKNEPATISIYASTFENKDYISKNTTLPSTTKSKSDTPIIWALCSLR